MIGLYGGTFAPLHNGHLRFAIEALEKLELDAVHFITSARPPHRDAPSVSPAERHRWIAMALEGCDRLVADDDEIRHRGPSYTVATLERARERFPGHTLLWLVGTDAFNSLHRWHEWQRLFALAHVVVAQRPGHPLRPDAQVAAYPRVEAEALGERDHGYWHALAIPELDISSTGIRRRLHQGRSVRGLIPDRLLDHLDAATLHAVAATAPEDS